MSQQSIFYAVGDGNDFEVVEKWIQDGNDVNVKDDTFGNSLLQTAALCGNTKIVKLLMEANARVDTVNGVGYTALKQVINRNNVEMTKIILEACQQQNVDLNRPVTANTLKNSGYASELVRDYMSNPIIHNVMFEPVLHHALKAMQKNNANDEIVKLVMEYPGIDYNMRNIDNFSALEIAAIHGRVDIVRTLLQRGADSSRKHAIKANGKIVKRGRDKRISLYEMIIQILQSDYAAYASGPNLENYREIADLLHLDAFLMNRKRCLFMILNFSKDIQKIK